MNILVTGATGFIGRALARQLKANGHNVHGAVRSPMRFTSACVAGTELIQEQDEYTRDPNQDVTGFFKPARESTGDVLSVRVSQGRTYRTNGPEGVRLVETGDIDGRTDWAPALSGVDAVVHLAARVHVMREVERDPLGKFREVNSIGTERLAVQAAAAGVKRLVYVSTIKVNGDVTTGVPFVEADVPRASDPYAISKWEAEQALHRVAANTGLEVVIVRPPLIYGPGVKGNFLGLMRIVYRGLPLPVGGCDNRRSLLGLGNFVDFLALCVRHPAAAGMTFLVADGEDLSTPELIRRLAAAMNRPARLVSIPPSWLRVTTRLFGRTGVYRRLCGSLQLDSSLARHVLGWSPSETVNEGLARTVESFIRQSHGRADIRGGTA